MAEGARLRVYSFPLLSPTQRLRLQLNELLLKHVDCGSTHPWTPPLFATPNGSWQTLYSEREQAVDARNPKC